MIKGLSAENFLSLLIEVTELAAPHDSQPGKDDVAF